MNPSQLSRRTFLGAAGALTGGFLVGSALHARAARVGVGLELQAEGAADYTLTIATKPVEIAPKRIVSITTYNGQFPGPLLRFKEGKQAVIDVRNDTDTPEQLHWHGQMIPADVDGAAEEGTPFIPPHGTRRIVFMPRPAGFRFYHTHVRAEANLSAGQYGGLVGPVYVEPKDHAGAYDREVFLTMKEFEPIFSRGGDMAMDFLAPAATVKGLRDKGESAMRASLAKGVPHGFEVGYDSFTINGKMLGHGEPIRVKQGERVLFHVLNGSAGEIRSLALPGHTFTIVAMDGNLLSRPVSVPVLWLGTAERISAIVTMNHPGVWVMGDLADDDRGHGMGIVIEYAGVKGKAQWIAPRPFRWNYARFGRMGVSAAEPDESFEMLFEKKNAALDGFNEWTINGIAYPRDQMMTPASFHLREGKRYRLRMRNASDDIHPVHLHRHTFEVTRVGGQVTSGLMKDVVMVGGYQEVEIDFVANNPGPTLFHCHQQLHMDFGFMSLFDYARES
ncbi:FtsP/CotA-like multicopper oxidase with cupredoxin domain [Edaphobacter aggregans]|uniref:FtsP/CotA-like multicopper oxidase with cupredoxin domain n=1 Tax=Edaphobacter aggregans TaxID=570835 RepID=A0A3R9NX64_9BACT|nr:multicopper oxidase domain-containing protein [Edaphobacter aggregans]RSL15765.1 FtsP/CotA-like multicopper oxidase with cupredoxin domain [Edaphobacter aggregans]